MHIKELPEKERKRIEKESRKMEKERERMEKESRRKDKARRESFLPQPSFGPPPSTNKLSKPAHTPAHLAHPYQPSPSPSQLGNPAIYTAPPPPQQQRQSSAPPPGLLAAFSQLESQDGSGYQSAYVVPGPSGSGNGGRGYGWGGRPTSIYGQGGNPVSSLLHKWSKD